MPMDNLVDLSSVFFQKREVSKHTYTPYTQQWALLFHFKSINRVLLFSLLSSQKRRKRDTRCAEIREDKEKQIVENHSNLLQKITF